MSKRRSVLLGVGIALVCVVALFLVGRWVADTPSSSKPRPIPPETAKAGEDPAADRLEVLSDSPTGPELGSLAEAIYRDIVDAQAKGIEKLARNPVHPGRDRLQQRMQNETFEETFLNLTEFWSVAMTIPLMGGYAFMPGRYDSDSVFLREALGVRKLLSEARAEPVRTASFLREQMSEMIKTYPAVRAEYIRMFENAPDGIVEGRIPMTDHRLRSAAAMYLLAELKDFDSLPMMMSLLPPEDKAFDNPDVPVNPKFVFYSMHRLASQMPEQTLSLKAREALGEYLALAKDKGVPEARSTTVTSWQAHYHEGDFRRMMPQQGLDLTNEPTFEMTVYPPLSRLTESDLRGLSSTLESFVRKAFPTVLAE